MKFFVFNLHVCRRKDLKKKIIRDVQRHQIMNDGSKMNTCEKKALTNENTEG